MSLALTIALPLALNVAIAFIVCTRTPVASLVHPVSVAAAGALLVMLVLAVASDVQTAIPLGVLNGVLLCTGAWGVVRAERWSVSRSRGGVSTSPPPRPAPIVNLAWFIGGAVFGVVLAAALYSIVLVVGMVLGGGKIG